MKSYIEAIDNLPEELRWPLVKAFEIFREEIADTVKKADFDELKAVVADLAEAQKRTEQRVAELAEAQKKAEERLTRLEITVQELIEAQKKTEQAIQRLTQEQIKIKEELGGLSHTVGYRLEDEAMKAILKLLKQDFGVEVVGRLKRDFIEISKNNYIEVNIFGEGRKNGKEYMIVGEAKSQLKKRNIDDFLKKVETLKRHIGKEPILLYVTYISHPQIRKYVEEKNIKIYHSYEL